MPTQSNMFDENPSLDGPDYVALVIEWDELAGDLERQLEGEDLVVDPKQPARWPRMLGIAAGAVGAAALAWGLYAWARR
jgi:hypothetical protein